MFEFLYSDNQDVRFDDKTIKINDCFIDNMLAISAINNIRYSELARALEVSDDMFYGILNGRYNTVSQDVKRLSVYLNCPCSVLLTNNTDVDYYSSCCKRYYPYASNSLLDAIRVFLSENSRDEGVSDVLLRRGISQTIRNTLNLNFAAVDFRGGVEVYARNQLGIGRSSYRDRPYLQFSVDNFVNYIGLYFDNDRRMLVVALHQINSGIDAIDKKGYKKIINKAFFENLVQYVPYSLNSKGLTEDILIENLQLFYNKMIICQEDTLE